jgi:VPDSG-CTERM motif
MNKLKYFTVILIAVAGLGLQQSQAHLLDSNQFFTAGPIGNPSDELSYLQSKSLLPATSQFLFKQNNDGTTDGLYGQYFTVTMTTGNSWDISWDLTGSGFTLDGVLIKDGKIPHTNNMLYRFYGVSADETLMGSGTVMFDGKNVSHVEFFGSPGGQVPDGGTTVMLLGTALGSLGMARRFLKK